MKLYKRLSLLLFACVLSFGLFSPLTVDAKETEGYTVTHYATIKNASNTTVGDYSLIVDGDDGVQNFVELGQQTTLNPNTYYSIITSYEINFDEPPVVAKGGEATVTLYDAYYSYGITTVHGFVYYRDINELSALLIYDDGTTQYINDYSYTQNANILTVSCTFTPNKNVKTIKFIAKKNFTVPSYKFEVSYYLGEMNGVDKGFKVDVTQTSEETGVLKGLLAKVNEFKDNVAEKFNNLIQGITELPQKLWNLISDGLKSLFVPDEEYISGFFDKFKALMSDRLGAVYQVIDIVLGSWGDIMSADETDTIKMPKVTIPLPENNEFSFGGYDVKIIPDGFDVLVNAVKMIIGIICTYVFINGLQRRYDEVMGVEQ